MNKMLVGLGIIFLALTAPLGVYYIYLDYVYEAHIGAYIENAYEVNTPESMIENINLAVEGMKAEHLEPSDYGALIFKRPDNIMSFQYKFLDNFNERAKAVEIWRTQTYSNGSSSTEQLGDVYETKMDNLREFLKENGRADWIAKTAWFLKNHSLFYIVGLISCFVFLIAGFITIYVGAET